MCTVCQIEAVSWGADDNAQLSGYIAINGNRVINTTSYAYIGINLVELDVSSCSASNIRHFNTHDLYSESDNMAIYINSLPLNTVLIGVSSDETQYRMSQNGLSALSAIGVSMTELQWRSKVSFVAQVGQPAKSVSQQAAPGGDNLKITAYAIGNY